MITRHVLTQCFVLTITHAITSRSLAYLGGVFCVSMHANDIINFTFCKPSIMIYIRNKNQQNAHFFIINGLIQLHCLRRVSNNINIKHILPSTRLLIWMHERNTIKQHVQVFLRMNTWLFETCRSQ